MTSSARIAALAALVAALPNAAPALELTGQAGVLGEWELTANLNEAVPKKEYSGPIALKHVGICSQDGPETKAGEMRLQFTSASRLTATLTIEGNPCTYQATKTDAFVGTMSCRALRDVPLRLWIR
jgi:hypothetical protein